MTREWSRGRGSAAQTVALLVCTFVVYLPALGGGYLWDDHLYVTGNPALRSLSGLADIWRIPPTTRQYYPLTFTSFWLEYRAWGDAPLGYHATNVILHAVNALLVWRVLAALEVPGALLAAWLFALHPVNVESVAWIAERKNVLSGCFALLATLAWTGFLAQGGRHRLAVTALAFTCALLSKTQVCTLPLVFALIAWWKQPLAWRRSIPPLVPLGVLSVAAAAVTILCEPTVTRAALPLPALRPIERILVAGRAVWFYAASLLWPVNLVAVYGHWPVDATAVADWAWPLALAVALAGLWSVQRQFGRGPFVAVAAFIACLLPVLGLVDFNFMRFSFVADHFQYLASVPLIALGAAAAARCTAVLSGGVAPARAIGRVVAAGLVLMLALASWRRAEIHRDEESLWRDNLARDPDSAVAHNHLGSVLLARRAFDAASAQFAAAARVAPGFADAHNNWGTALKEQGRLDDALAQYSEAMRLNPADPVVHNNLGVARHMTGDSAAALQQFAQAVQLDPTYAQAQDNWGRVLLDLGRPEEAIDHLRIAVRLEPTDARGQLTLGVTLLTLGRADEARVALGAAVALDPTSADAHHHLGVALGMIGRLDESLDHLATAAHLNPGDADIQNHWGVALSLSGRHDDAIGRFESAIRIRPDDADARANLAKLLAQRPEATRNP
jgi:tetratricopeptide (TPR) repeat protein